MRAGPLRHQITLQRRSRAGDTFGDSRGTDTWTDLATVRADVRPLRGREFFEAQQVKSEVTHKVVMRYCSDLADLSPKDRIKFGTRYLDILSVLNMGERDRVIEVMARED